ncbi:MAG: hypothetical protein F6J86_41840 [Symploca sp. SIO1B1]|nr:hypothetical protein [Symploca sp. SIO1B1]
MIDSFAPKGSYLDSSEVISVVLSGMAEKIDRSRVLSHLDITSLNPNGGEVENIDGKLVWQKRQIVYVDNNGLPAGSYIETVENPVTIMKAKARRLDGSYNVTSCHVRSLLDKNLVNVDGRLIYEDYLQGGIEEFKRLYPEHSDYIERHSDTILKHVKSGGLSPRELPPAPLGWKQKAIMTSQPDMTDSSSKSESCTSLWVALGIDSILAALSIFGIPRKLRNFIDNELNQGLHGLNELNLGVLPRHQAITKLMEWLFLDTGGIDVAWATVKHFVSSLSWWEAAIEIVKITAQVLAAITTEGLSIALEIIDAAIEFNTIVTDIAKLRKKGCLS